VTEASRYPLSWPFGWKRTEPSKRQRAKFSRKETVYSSQPGGHSYTRSAGLTVATAMDRLKVELARLQARDIVVSTNVELTTYGEPRSGRRPPDDPGVAVYFRLKGKDRVLACDAWDNVAGNIAAVAAHIDAIRRVDRYGVGTLDQAFAGYDALPPPGANNRPHWRKVFDLPEGSRLDRALILSIYRRLASEAHPDKPGGSHEAMSVLNVARDAALQEIG
jgi:hypothetical protein